MRSPTGAVGQQPFLCPPQTPYGLLHVLGLLEGAQESVYGLGQGLGGGPEWGRRPPSHWHPALVQREVYVVEAVLMSFLLGVVEAGPPERAQTVVHQVLDLLWLFMEVRPGRGRCGEALEKAARTAGPGCPRRLAVQPDRLFQDYEVQDCLKQLMMSLLRLYRFSPIVPDLSLQVGAPAPGPEPPGPPPPSLSTLSLQIRYLRLTIAILSHQKSRKFLLSNVLYPPLAARQPDLWCPLGPAEVLGGWCTFSQGSPWRLRRARATLLQDSAFQHFLSRARRVALCGGG